jgi:hypothetical protein
LLNLDYRNIGDTVRLSKHEDGSQQTLEGVITAVDTNHVDRLWHQVKLNDEWTYLSNWGAHTVLTVGGKSLPTEIGVYKIKSAALSEKDLFVQRDDEGQWWPHPYVFSGWRNEELLIFPSLELQPELSVDYPAIKDPAEEQAYLNSMALKAEIWREGRRSAERGEQAFRNPYAICGVCRGQAGEHVQKIHDDQYKE